MLRSCEMKWYYDLYTQAEMVRWPLWNCMLYSNHFSILYSTSLKLLDVVVTKELLVLYLSSSRITVFRLDRINSIK